MKNIIILSVCAVLTGCYDRGTIVERVERPAKALKDFGNGLKGEILCDQNGSYCVQDRDGFKWTTWDNEGFSTEAEAVEFYISVSQMKVTRPADTNVWKVCH